MTTLNQAQVELQLEMNQLTTAELKLRAREYGLDAVIGAEVLRSLERDELEDALLSMEQTTYFH